MLVRREQERLTRPLGLLMRADGLDELKRLLDDLGVEIEPAFVSVLDVVEVTPDRQFDVAACDDLTAQDRVTVAADAGCMVSRCHAGDVDFGPLQVVSGGYS